MFVIKMSGVYHYVQLNVYSLQMAVQALLQVLQQGVSSVVCC